MRGALALEPSVVAMAADQVAADRLLVLARGYEYATAREWALKLKELAHVFADPYSAADFQHGPLALLEPGVPVLAMVRPGPTEPGARDPPPPAAGRTGCGPRGRVRPTAALALARWPLPVPARHAGVARTDRVDRRRPAARDGLTSARGLDPEAPRNIHKVTRTR